MVLMELLVTYACLGSLGLGVSGVRLDILVMIQTVVSGVYMDMLPLQVITHVMF